MFRFSLILPLALLTLQSVRAATDITFFSVSDVHYGQTGNGANNLSKDTNRVAIVRALNNLAGTTYPSSVGGGVVGTPRGLTIPGDLIEIPDTNLWNRYKADYGVNKEGRVQIPVFDGLGNHDILGAGPSYTPSSIVKNEIVRRNAQRATPVNLDTNNLHYSWDWDGVHFVQLNLFIGSAAYASPTVTNAVWDPSRSLEFLQRDLQTHVGSSGRPVLVLQHFDFVTSEGYWPNTARTNMFNLLKNYNCIGLIHGHSHAEKVYKYPTGDPAALDIYDDGTAMNGDIFVFRIIDGQMFVVNRTFSNNQKDPGVWGTIAFQKTISMGTASAVQPKTAAGRSAQGLAFSIAGLGRIYAGNLPVRKVEILNMSGRKIRDLSVNAPELSWDRRDAAGNLAAPGLYVVRFVAEKTAFTAKALLR